MTRHLPALFFALSGISLAGPLYTAPFGPGGTWNLYQLSDEATTWEAAREQALSTKAPAGDPEAKGHLATCSSMAENQFMRTFSGRRSVWFGLSDDERFGGHESNNHPLDGWKWLDGSDLTFTNWKPAEPDEWAGAGNGEDAGIYDRNGRWSDGSSGFGEQLSTESNPALIEWETHSKEPVAGAIPLTPVWPREVNWPPLIPGKWNASWVVGYVSTGAANQYRKPVSISEAGRLLAKMAIVGNPANGKNGLLVESQGTKAGRIPWLWLTTRDQSREGWLPPAGPEETNFPELPQSDGYIGAVVGRIHVEKAGTYTFAVTAEEAFALRIGGFQWKSASGYGFIDPLDPLTFTQPCTGPSSKALAVIDLPAGDHLVQALWMVEQSGSEFHILSAPGSHLTEGDTADWRPLGHERSPVRIPSLGVTAAGWTVEATKPPAKVAKNTKFLGLQDGLVKLELDLARTHTEGVSAILYDDAPSLGATHFPGAAPFPNKLPGIKNDHWVMRASARLVVPEDGSYQIGVHAQGLAALRIRGAEVSRISQASQIQSSAHLRNDTVDFEGSKNSDYPGKLVTQWFLKKGETDIEVFYVKHIGPASLAVFSSPTGPYPPALIRAGGAKLADDQPGLPHASH